MNFLLELWPVIVSGTLSWLDSLNNERLSKIATLLTILVILIGLTHWTFGRRKNTEVTEPNPKEHKPNKLGRIENTQKSFRAVDMLNNPMGAGEKIGTLVTDTTKILGGKGMKKFIKWLWYNKEQLLSIVYQVISLAIANVILFTDALNTITMLYFGAPTPLWVKIVAVVIVLFGTGLSVRNVVVKYGLSSLETIDSYLKEKAEAKANKLSPEQKQVYKNYISTLNDTLNKAKKELQDVESELTRLTVLYNADNSLVADYSVKVASLQKTIASGKENVITIEDKIAHFKALLSGQPAK